VDGLTQINNKRFFLEFLEREMGRCHRYNRALSLVMFDIDHFKKINDSNGHLAGDYVLRELALLIRGRIRKEECFARYGGEEFSIVMPEAGPDNARRFAEKVRKMVEDHPFTFEQKYHEEIYQMTIVDGLTQINNKRFFLEFIEREMGRCHRYSRSLSLIMFDIDHFKKINDSNGHLAGDYVLRELAHAVKQRVRKEECFARYGGEEFAIVMPEAGPENARRFAEKLRKLTEDHHFEFEQKSFPVTVSIGVADMTADMTEPLQFIKSADANLYKAKKSGRNRVVG
jgi:diguanylate cyclase (GGDEF)-like protein